MNSIKLPHNSSKCVAPEFLDSTSSNIRIMDLLKSITRQQSIRMSPNLTSRLQFICMSKQLMRDRSRYPQVMNYLDNNPFLSFRSALDSFKLWKYNCFRPINQLLVCNFTTKNGQMAILWTCFHLWRHLGTQP
jgi:hypothetical protein